MKCSPDGCPIVAFSDLTPAEQRVERRRTAEKMAKQGFTEQQIAKQLGVSQATVSGLLGNLSEIDKLKPAKTASNPKGAGRPKSNKLAPERRINSAPVAASAARSIIDEGLSYPEAERETGFSNTVLRAAVAREEGRREAEPNITPEMLSMSAQEKLDAAVRQYRRKLDLQFEQRVLDEIKRRIDEIVLPSWKQRIDQAQELYKRRRGLMDKETFNKIRRGLHPDSRNSISDKVLGEAFDTFMSLEKFLLDEKDSPTDIPAIPNSLAEWDKWKAQRKKWSQRRRPDTKSSLRRR